MAPQSDGRRVRDVLDEIGEKIQKDAHNASEQYHKVLQGDLSKVKFSDNTPNTETDPCLLNHIYHTNVTRGYGREDPCYGRVQDRFSDERRSQCTSNRIRGSVNDEIGACAPCRRLHVCDENLEVIKPENITSSDNLLMDVLLAAKYEGQSLMEKYPHNEHHNKEGICIALARSFADIGDIIRGKDLYRGNSKEKDKLQEQLKKYFKQLHINLQDPAKSHYNDPSGNFYQLREDWWNANRQQVWKAITCKAENAQYFRNTCSMGKNSTQTNCQCIDGEVPTYFDYVPQYLRWFDEWTEDFCRKRNLKLDNAIKNCRGENNDKYCSRNGYDCKETVRKINKYRWDNACAGCFFSCSHFVKWIDNKKKEFEKQKKKCENEIYRNNESSQNSPKNYNNIYETDFYGNLKKDYQSMNDFLKLLNNEKQCKNIIDEKSKIDFTKNPEETFSHTEYCDPCPWCGLKDKKDGTWERKGEGHKECPPDAEYKPPDGVTPTEINVLYTGEGNKDILDKLKDFCKTQVKKDVKNEKWKCYKNENEDKCVLEPDENLGIDKKVKDYVDFMMFWINHMLKDSIDWRKYITRCINNTTSNKCKKGCFKNCKCFEKWIKKKQEEWNKIKEHYKNEKDFKEFDPYKTLETILEEDFFKDIKVAYGNEEAVDRIEKLKKEHASKPGEDPSTAKYAIDILLEHEKEEAELCLEIHPEEEKCADEYDSDEDDHEELPIMRSNPCATPSGSYPSLANKAAHQMHDQARQQLTSRAGRSLLRGDATRGHYDRGGTGNDFKNNLCGITQKHSNAINNSNDPCNGKGDRFKIGKTWEQKHSRDTTYSDVYLPPRRQHMCTSNLEKIDVGKVTGNSNVNDSFLGDVLLAANYEAKKIKELYKQHNGQNDHIGMCRAVRNSFADLGDIIRGRDMWDKDSGAQDMERNLKKIFEKIKSNLPGIQDKYTGDEKNNPPYKQLREDWWEANRHQIWKAMKCEISELKDMSGHHASSSHCGYSHGTPLDDYIPQRLRWMTEWAEWYCKEQSRLYNKLVADCGDCMKKGEGSGKDCTQKDKECSPCKEACDKYKHFIDTWKQQWDAISDKYLILYLQAQTTVNNGKRTVFPDAGPDYQLMVDFLIPIHKASIAARNRVKRAAPGLTGDTATTPNTPYFTAAGYIHQELPNVGCNTQKEFCDNNKGKYTFKEPPDGYGDACTCNTRNKPEPKKQKDACEIVEVILAGKKGNQQVGECNPKDQDGNYPGWDCENNIDTNHTGACMPPRRQKLCLYYLKELNGETENDLREAFIKTAAAETFLSWQYYKTKNGDNAETQLNNGTIPPEFLRSMFYTYADYRDICLNSDISKKVGDVSNAKNKIDKIFLKKDDQTPDEQRKAFWGKYRKDIWEGMLCALEKDGGSSSIKSTYSYKTVTFTSTRDAPTLTEFSEKHQFLRWFTEWGEHFCTQRITMLDILKEGCTGCNLNSGRVTGGNRTCQKNGEACTE
ncbi:hypothetical protein PFFCH_01115, partial [Plasmodium falciparum FCH/4]